VIGEPLNAGERALSVTIATNVPTLPQIQVPLTLVGVGEVPYVAYASPSVSLGSVSLGRSASASFFVETREAEGQPPWLLEPRCTLTQGEATVEGGVVETLPRGDQVVFRRYEYTVHATPGDRPGDITGEVALIAQGESAPIRTIGVHGMLRPAVYATPATVYLDTSTPGDGRVAHVMVRAADRDFPLEVEPVDFGEGHPLSVRPVARQSNTRAFRVELAGKPAPDTPTEIRFRTNHPDCPSLAVPVVLGSEL
jgi:hypothetical protein